MSSLFPVSLPGTATTEPVAWGGLVGASHALLIAETAAASDGAPLFVVAGDQRAADELEEAIRFFAADDLPVLHFPDWETLPYDSFSPHQDIISQRLGVLAELPTLKRGVVVVAAASLLQRLPPLTYVQSRSLSLQTGQTVERKALLGDLSRVGYLRVPEVGDHGEFAVRGSIVDLFPMGTDEPFRIDFFDDDIESIRHFDPDTQLSGDIIDRIAVLPGREVPLDADAVKRFRQAWRERFAGQASRSPVYRDVSEGIAHGGIEYYLPLFFNSTASLFDYLPANAIVAHGGSLRTRLEAALDGIVERHELVALDADKPVLKPEEAFHGIAAIEQRLQRLARLQITAEKPIDGVDFKTRPLPVLRTDSRRDDPLESLESFMSSFDGRLLFVAESPGRREALAEQLRARNHPLRTVGGWNDFVSGDGRRDITIGPVEKGFALSDGSLAIVPEQALLGERVRQRRRRRRGARDPQAVIAELSDLRPGAPVVHEDYGVGRYLSLSALEIGGIESEYVTLEYAGGDKLYVPVHALDKITRYTGASAEQAPLHRLGSDQWARARRRAAEKAYDVAAELLDVYARRAARSGHSFHYSESDYRAFADAFAFEPTEDQRTVIGDVLGDMRKAVPMDRVVCGDVGFGKTEVALRAAFVAVHGGKQVALLVPTTLLAQQHYQTFRDRFADWPVHIEVISRFRSQKEVKRILAGLGDGSIDIIIGTHKLLQHRDAFRDIGLVIVDEEHRFGVRQKEQIKSLRSEIDILTLTATPIPRTLNMALGGLRELSLITTPPSDRLSIKTFVTEWNDALIREAMLREIKRGGQVYFVHNRVRDIEDIAKRLRKLVPEASLEIAHGQMAETELEKIMVDFYHRRFNVLLCTTIIESGIDVPTANTILINRADRFGLAQLHQLRGRVGRSHHRAYAYLLAPPKAALSADAAKRLEAIDSLEDLGAGFALASHDLEIRGAGELLGDVQSGQIQEIGFAHYNELLAEAVRSLRNGRTPDFDKPLNAGVEVNVHAPALLPDDYVHDIHLRLILYKRIASAVDEDRLLALKIELIDRFGPLPQAAARLIEVTKLKLAAKALGITKVDVSQNGGYLQFGPGARVAPETLIGILQSRPGMRMRDSTRLSFNLDDADVSDRIDAVTDLLGTLAAGTPEADVAS